MTAPHYHSHVDDPAAVGRRLKDARLAAGLSQRQLSFPGCSAAYISRLEAGDRVPSLQLLRKLAAKLNADEQYLATGVEQIKQAPPELIEAEVERRLAGGRPDARASGNRPSGRSRRPGGARARPLGALARRSPPEGSAGGAARFARDALALLDYADDRRSPARSIVAHGAPCARPQRRRGVAHHPRLRQLRRHRLVPGVLRRGRDRGRGARAARCGVGSRDHDLRHGRRLRRRPQRVVPRQLAALAGARGARPDRADDEDVQPDERRRRLRARAGADPAPARHEPRAAGGRRGRSLPPTRNGRGDAGRGDDRRLRAARRRGDDPRLRRQQRRRALARGGAPARSVPPGRRTRTRCSSATTRPPSSRSSHGKGSATRPSARSPAAG